ncbi:MAG: GNAT family N-acetyltransferase [Lachnospiraceae bacterium]|nr:GNAT family N-acetyltransferase [Lachnospiraceae bacterium]
MELKLNQDTNCTIYAGKVNMEIQPLPVYSDIVCEFLDDLSRLLRRDKRTAGYPDVMAFAFWCRKGNILKRKQGIAKDIVALGRGLAFHITPSNVPVNFAFSFAFGCLAGNANVVRVPSKEYEQTVIICDGIRSLWEQEKYKSLASRNLILSYDKSSHMTEELSAICDVRIIWGGDDTIHDVRACALKSKAIEVVFADRYSFGVIDCGVLKECSDEEMTRLAEGFYNDTYGMDQNACSTPHMIFFLQPPEMREESVENSAERFWDAVYRVAEKRYALEDIKVSDKYMEMCKAAVEKPECRLKLQRENVLYVLEVPSITTDDITEYRGRFGMFYQHTIHSMEELLPYMQQKVQSMLYYGVSGDRLKHFIEDNHLMGIDRVVPFGSALDMDVFWDGYDIITQMSRRIEMQLPAGQSEVVYRIQEKPDLGRIPIRKEQGYLLADRLQKIEIPLQRSAVDFAEKIRMEILLTGEYRETICQIAEECFPDDTRFVVTFSRNEERRKTKIRQYIMDCEQWFICRYKEEIAGFIIPRIESEREVSVYLAAVRPEYRISGAALSLYSYVAQYYKEKGYKKLTGEISSRNVEVANIYISLGGRFVGAEDIYLLER